MNDIVKFFGGSNLPATQEKLVTALSGLAAAKNSLMGKMLLRLTKQGIWVFGMDNTKLPAGTKLVANPASFSSGYVAWYLGQLEAEKMQPLTAGPIDANSLGEVKSGSVPPGKKEASGKGWETQVSVELLTTDEAPVHLIYKSSSAGGTRALLELAGAIAYGLSENPRRAFPVLEADVDSYTHKEYGEVFTPRLDIVSWLDADGKPISDKATKKAALV